MKTFKAGGKMGHALDQAELNRLSPSLFIPGRAICFLLPAILLGLFSVSADGRTKESQPPFAVTRAEWADLKEEAAYSAQQLRLLRMDLDRLTRESNALREALERQKENYALLLDNYVTIAQLNENMRELREELKEAVKTEKTEIIEAVGSQIVRLATQTEEAMNALAASLEAQPQRKKAIEFSDDYPREGIVYTVLPGDTLSKIAKKFNSSIPDIQNANKIADPTKLMAGQSIFIPRKK